MGLRQQAAVAGRPPVHAQGVPAPGVRCEAGGAGGLDAVHEILGDARAGEADAPRAGSRAPREHGLLPGGLHGHGAGPDRGRQRRLARPCGGHQAALPQGTGRRGRRGGRQGRRLGRRVDRAEGGGVGPGPPRQCPAAGDPAGGPAADPAEAGGPELGGAGVRSAGPGRHRLGLHGEPRPVPPGGHGAAPEAVPGAEAAAAEHLVLVRVAILAVDLPRAEREPGAGPPLSPAGVAAACPRQEQARARGSVQRLRDVGGGGSRYDGPVPRRHNFDAGAGVPVLSGQEPSHPVRRGRHPCRGRWLRPRQTSVRAGADGPPRAEV
mmetsp:Transcript_1793/g.3578  ORF Transcript_1793/g.3578 Transcript_1793/m.3578 type:complete len:322 (+) Transcript_1793:720-1685(+)